MLETKEMNEVAMGWLMLPPLARKALEFATEAHMGQRRKHSNLPYIVHPFGVAMLLLENGYGEDTIAAALLHDVVEDTKFEHIDIERRFGEGVAKLVKEVTDVSKKTDGNRETRFQIDLEHLKGISYDGAAIKLADIVHNTSDPAMMVHNPKFASTYASEKYRQVEELVKINDDYILINMIMNNLKYNFKLWEVDKWKPSL